MKNIISIATLTISLLSFNILAQDDSSVPDSTMVDIPLEFTDSGGFPPRPNELTYQEANIYCEMAQRSVESSEYNVFTSCMNSFKPYKDPDDEAATCPSQTRSWASNCSATVPYGGVGEEHVVYHEQNGDNYQGSAKFTCVQGQWVLEDPVCINMPDNCPSNAQARWPVTEPAWAVKGATDNPRYAPKPDCTAQISNSITGQVKRGVPQDGVLDDAIDPWEPVYYDNNYADLKCFNGEWKPYHDGQQVCIYEPKGCPATDYVTEDGCTFKLSTTPHNKLEKVENVFAPEKSQGQVEAFCWDGKWEIKNEVCELSCLNDFEEKSWASSPTTTESCYHKSVPDSGITPTERTAPNSTHALPNETSGLVGEVVRRCEDGFWKNDSEYCRPQSCVGISSSGWTVNGNSCQHNATSKVLRHGESIDLPNTVEGLSGTKHYYCDFGTLKTRPGYNSCTSGFNDRRCYADEPKLTGSHVMEFDTWNPNCSATCRKDVNSDYVYCSAECLPEANPHCTNPLSENGGRYAKLTNTSCNVKVAQSPSSLVDDNIGRVLRKYECNSGNWNQIGTECVVEYDKEITVVKPDAPEFTPTPGVDCSATTIEHPYTSGSGESYKFSFNLPDGEHSDSPISKKDTVSAKSGDDSCSSKTYIANAKATCSSSKWNVNTTVECEPLTPVQNDWEVEIYCADEGGALNPSLNGDCSNSLAKSENETWTVITPIIDSKLASKWDNTTTCSGKDCEWNYSVSNMTTTGDVTSCNVSKTNQNYLEVIPVYNESSSSYTGSCRAEITISVGDNEGRTSNVNAIAKATINKEFNGCNGTVSYGNSCFIQDFEMNEGSERTFSSGTRIGVCTYGSGATSRNGDAQVDSEFTVQCSNGNFVYPEGHGSCTCLDGNL